MYQRAATIGHNDCIYATMAFIPALDEPLIKLKPGKQKLNNPFIVIIQLQLLMSIKFLLYLTSAGFML